MAKMREWYLPLAEPNQKPLGNTIHKNWFPRAGSRVQKSREWIESGGLTADYLSPQTTHIFFKIINLIFCNTRGLRGK